MQDRLLQPLATLQPLPPAARRRHLCCYLPGTVGRLQAGWHTAPRTRKCATDFRCETVQRCTARAVVTLELTLAGRSQPKQPKYFTCRSKCFSATLVASSKLDPDC